MNRVCVALIATAGLTGCVGADPQRWIEASPECGALRSFIVATPAEQSRTVAVYRPAELEEEDGVIFLSLYATLHASPDDAVAREFYGSFARASHYFGLDEIGRGMVSCLRRETTFERARSGLVNSAIYLNSTHRVRLETSRSACAALPAGEEARDVCLLVEVMPRDL